MKKLYSLSFAAVAALMLFSSCSKDEFKNPVQDQEEVVPFAEKVTISVSMPDEGLTKVTLTQDAENKKVIKLAWQDTDELDINGETFKVKTGSISVDGKSAEFEGTAPTPIGGKYNISYSNLPGEYAEQTQSADGDATHLGYAVSISDADSYTGITFSEDGATAVGGTFSQSSILRLRAKLPDAVASAVQKVIFKASESVFAGAKELTVNLSTHGTAGDDKTLDVYATLPAGDAINAAAMDLLIQFQTSANAYDKYTAYRQIPANTNFGTPQYIGIDCSNIDKYAGKDDAGTAEKSYLIGDQHQMNWLSSNIASGHNVKLVDDIDMTGVTVSLNPDGAVTFEGNGKVISNTTAPLFDDLKGTVRNFTIYNAVITSAETVGILANTCNNVSSNVSNVTVTGDESPTVSSLINTVSSGRVYVGGLIGEISTLSTFDDCHVKNTTVSVPADGDYSYTGGAVGYFHHVNSHTAKIRYCTIESCSISSFSNTGGLVGYFERGNVHTNKVGYDADGNEKKCTINAPDNELIGNYKGGLIGVHRYGHLTNNSVLCTIRGSIFIGGLVGQSYQSVSDCVSAGEVVSSSTEKYSYVGGLIGEARADLTNCHSTSSVIGTAVTYVYAGGLVGKATGGTIDKCSATGSVKSDQAYMGGLIGQIDGNVTVKNSYATGDIAVGNNAYTGRGGFVGNINSGTVSISNCYSTGIVSIQRWSGGFIGNIGDIAKVGLTASNCYTSSPITHTTNNYGLFIGNANKDDVEYNGIIAWNTSSSNNFIFNITSEAKNITEAPYGNYFGTEGTINSQATALGWGSIVDDSSNPVWDLTWADNRPHLAWEEKP